MATRNGSATGYVVGLVGFVASCIAIYSFVTGYASLPQTMTDFNKPKPTSQNSGSGTSIFDLIATPIPTPAVAPETSAGIFLPDSSDVNENWQETQNETLSNEELAKSFDDPSSVFLLFESWERIKGQSITYEHVSSCDFKQGVQYMVFSVAVYGTENGAKNATNWFADNDSKMSMSQQQSYDVGDETYISWFDGTNSCDPSDNIRQLSVRFRKHNVTVNVFLSSVKETVSDEELLKSAIWFAKRIELKIVAFTVKQ